MAEVMRKPVIRLSSLAIVASMADASESLQPAADLVHAVLDAGRGEFYHGIYRNAGWTCVSETLETLPALQAAVAHAPGLVVVSEPSVLGDLACLAPCQVPPATVRDALPLALVAWRASRFCEVASLDANYLRSIGQTIVAKARAPGLADAQTSGV